MEILIIKKTEKKKQWPKRYSNFIKFLWRGVIFKLMFTKHQMFILTLNKEHFFFYDGENENKITSTHTNIW